jgi:hypothetical protein
LPAPNLEKYATSWNKHKIPFYRSISCEASWTFQEVRKLPGPSGIVPGPSRNLGSFLDLLGSFLNHLVRCLDLPESSLDLLGRFLEVPGSFLRNLSWKLPGNSGSVPEAACTNFLNLLGSFMEGPGSFQKSPGCFLDLP